MFAKLKEELAPACPSFRTLCPTRWTVRGRSLQSVIDNYRVFQELWDDTLEVATDFDTKSRLGGVKAAMNTFNFLFGLVLGERLLKHTDNLSQTLQDPDLAACEAQATAELTCETLSRTRTDEASISFGKKHCNGNKSSVFLHLSCHAREEHHLGWKWGLALPTFPLRLRNCIGLSTLSALTTSSVVFAPALTNLATPHLSGWKMSSLVLQKVKSTAMTLPLS